MSLTTCLKKADNFLPASDKAAILEKAREYRQQGLSPSAAASRAVTDQLAQVQSELDAVTQQEQDGQEVKRSPARDPQTETPAFKKWFGDSKVVDANGRPLVVYHGTSADFSEFKMGEDGGVFFTADTKIADNYGGSTVMPVYLSIKKPYEVTNRQWYEDADEVLSPEDARDAGYDGYVIRGHEHGAGQIANTYIAFRPTQIKSATGNKGEFNPANNNITESKARDLTDTPAFKQFYGDSKLVDATGKPMVMYHGTSKAFTTVDMKKGAQGLFWMTSDKAAIEAGDVGAQGKGAIMPLYAAIKSPAGWKEYEQKSIAELKRDGYDGIILPDSDGSKTAVIFDPTQVKSADKNNGDFDVTNKNIKKSPARPEFYSQLQRAIEGVPDRLATMAAPQWKLWLDANAGKLGVKKDEIEYSGVKDFLDMRGKDKVTREEIASYLDANGVKVNEVVLGGSPYQEFKTVRDAQDFLMSHHGQTRAELIDDYGYTNKDDYITVANELFVDLYPESAVSTKYGSYTVPGGENYREILITLPAQAPKNPGTPAFQIVGAFPHDGQKTRAAAQEYIDRLTELGKTTPGIAEQLEKFPLSIKEYTVGRVEGDNYKSSHFDQANILAHLRVDDRTDSEGKKVLFLQEVQSDWGQDGKKKGFVTEGKLPEGWIVVEQPTYRYRGGPQDGTEWMVYDKTKTQAGFASQTKDGAIASATRAGPLSGVPTAPFVGKTEAWVGLAIKRAIMHAASNGYDKVAFINGEQAAGLYDLSKQISKVSWDKDTGRLTAYDKNTSERRSDGRAVIDESGVDETRLENYIGKEAAKRLMESEPDEDGTRELSGLDLKVGGEGMKTFYDTLVPQVANDVLKKLGGGKMGAIGFEDEEGGYTASYGGNDILQTFDTREEAMQELRNEARDSVDGEANKDAIAQWMDDADATVRANNKFRQQGFTITPAMREKMAGGVPLFSPAREAADSTPRNQTDTPAFKAFFGDSVVTDTGKAGGKPLVVYHGTQASFDKFDEEMQGSTVYSEDVGFFFTNDPVEASSYATLDWDKEKPMPNVMPSFLSIKNPMVITLQNEKSPYDNPAIWYDNEGREAVESAQAAGYDGLIVRDERDDMKLENGTQPTLYVAFQSTQIKSAIGNNGNFDGTKANITQSTPRNGDGVWQLPEASKFDDFVYKMQNKMIDTKRVIEAMGPIDDERNVYLQEELFHGRAAKQTTDFGNDELKPLMEKMAAKKVTIAGLEEYLHAKHAREANQVIAERNPDSPDLQDGGSGMSNAAAAAYLSALPTAEKVELAELAGDVRQILDKTRQLYADYGLESQDKVEGWAGMFENYIPLQREDKDGNGSGMGMGQGFSVKGKEVKGRTGSKRKVVDIIGNIAMQRERLIVRGEKNRVAVALVGLATANPNKDFWSVGSPPADRVYDPKTNTVVERVDPMFKSRDNVLVAKVRQEDGSVVEQAVVFNEDQPRAVRMAVALKNLDAGNLEGLLGVSAKITRYFAAINTQYNPVFGVVNLIRDVQGAMVNLGGTPLAKSRTRIAKDTLSAIRGIYSDMRSGGKGSKWSDLWEQFQNEGGQTGYRELFRTGEDRANELKKALNPDGWMDSPMGKLFTANGALRAPMSVATKGSDWLFGWLSDYNEAMENGVRLAAFKAGLDQGMSAQKAASLAKNLTVNFNRKGQVGQQAGAVFAFFNAAMQGSARIGQTLFDMDGSDLKTLRLSKTGKQVVYGGLVLGSLQALALAAAGFDDEDPPDFVRERALIIPTGGKTYISIPMPLGLHVIPGMGRQATEFALSGFKDPAKRVIDMTGMFVEAFNPIGSAGWSMQTLAPTALDPLVALSENRDWTGKPITRTSSNPSMPGHAMRKDTATGFSKVLSEAINSLSGGNEYVAGALSPTPDQIDYLLAQVGGGVVRELSKIEQTTFGVARGEAVPTFKIPLVGRFIGNAGSQASEGTAFYANVEKANAIETEVKGMKKDGKNIEAQALMKSKPEGYLIAQANAAERQIQALRREKRVMLDQGADRDAIKAMEVKITAVMTRLNRSADQLRERQAGN